MTPKREALSPPAAQPITLPPAGRPGAGASIDWQQALRREVRARELAPPPGKLEFGLPRRPAAGPTVPRFGWDYARTHRVEPLPEGGLLINLSDRCAVVLYVLPIPVCRIGRIPPGRWAVRSHARPAQRRPRGIALIRPANGPWRPAGRPDRSS